jgi:glycosyltransferase involved in cell wall biosynthesis
MALPSAKIQNADEIIILHDPNGTAASCRNQAIEKAGGEFIICVDADDELEPGYVEAMMRSQGDLRYPSVLMIPGEGFPIVLPRKHLLLGNYMVIGTGFRKSLWEQVGGFTEHETWEDWFLFMQMTYVGAVPVLCKDAVYRVHKHAGSRVSVPDPMKTFLHMKEEFRQWARKYNGGQTMDNEYRKFIVDNLPPEGMR